jgi:citrate synthase
VSYREIPGAVIDTLRKIPKTTHAMAALETGISMLGCLDPDADKCTMESETEISFKLIAQMATVAGAIGRLRQGKEPVDPDPTLEHTANYLYMTTGKKPDELMEKVMDVAMILHADHGMNNSTFTTMCIHSTLSDMYSAIVGGIGSLKGPLHGGANEQALAVLLKLKDEEDATRYVKDCIANKKKIMGFGHRVYKAYDPRAKVLGKFSQEVTQKKGMGHLYRIAKRIEDEVIAAYGEKGIFPNVDFYSGTVYYAFGIEPAMFTPIFAVSRISGWCARVLEYFRDNRIFRPRAMYVGARELTYVPMDQR